MGQDSGAKTKPSNLALRGTRLALPATLTGALLMLGAALAVALDTVVVRIVAQELHPTMIVFFRTLFSLLAMTPWLMRVGPAGFATRQLPLHGARAVIKVAALLCFYYAIAVMPLAEVTAIAFATPLFAAAGAVLFLGEPRSLRRTLATILGFAGILLIIQPEGHALGPGTAAAVASAIGLAVIGLMVKRLARHDAPNTIVVLNLALITPLALLLALPYWTTPSPTVLAWLTLQGLIGAIAQLCFTRAMRLADASLLMPIDFIRLPLVAALAYLAFGEVPDGWTFVGAAVVCAALVSLLRSGGRSRPVETTISER